MASSSSRTCSFRPSRGLKVTFLNNSVSRSKRPFDHLQDGDQSLKPDVKRRVLRRSPRLAQASARPSTSSSGGTSADTTSLTTHGYYEVTELDNSSLDFVEGELSGVSFNWSPEDEYRHLSEDIANGYLPIASNVTELWTVSGVLNKINTEPLPLTGPSFFASDSFAHRDESVTSEMNSLNVNSSISYQVQFQVDSPAFQGGVPIKAASLCMGEQNDEFGVPSEEATQTVGNNLQIVNHPVVEQASTSVTEGLSEQQAFIFHNKLGGETASNRSTGFEEESDSADLPGGATMFQSEPAIDQNEDHVENSSETAGLLGEAAASHCEDPVQPTGEQREDPVQPTGEQREDPVQPTGEQREDPVQPTSEQREDRLQNPSTEAFLRPRQLIQIPEEELESSLQKYINGVVAHVGYEHFIDEVNELQALMGRVSSNYYSQENNYRHPTDLTSRHYAQRTERTAQLCSLSQWVDKNQRHFRRFQGIPKYFERSPVPSLQQ